jgi:two-component system, cell cycle response regulator DivK
MMSLDRTIAGTRILLVEDDDDNRNVFEIALRHAGALVISCVDGDGAVHRAHREMPDLILMDLSLPVLDGWEATRRLKADERTCRIPIVALTAHALPEARKRAEEAGFDAYLTKPIAPMAVVHSVRALLGRPGTLPLVAPL